jgi:hypothetical protein
MARKKYSKYVKTLEFKESRPDFYRQGIKLGSDFFGFDVLLEMGTYIAPGRLGINPGKPHVHNFDQVMIWLGVDTDDIGDLDAEIEVCLGEDLERHMITTSTAMFIPKGTPHYPATINRMDKKSFYIEISYTKNYSEKLFKTDKKAGDYATYMSKTRGMVQSIAFIRKGAWSYGATNRDDSGGNLAFINGKGLKNDFLLMFESLKKAPYRFGPNPSAPHTHPMPEVLFFLGSDPDNMNELGGEAELALGKEKEIYVINKPTAVLCPDKFPHCPLTITKVDKPFFLMDCRPFGMMGKKDKMSDL